MYTFYLYLKNQKRISFMIVPELCFQVFKPLFFLFEILNQYKLGTFRPFIPASTLFYHKPLATNLYPLYNKQMVWEEEVLEIVQ